MSNINTSNIKLIVGLCNPGTEYKDTRHNAGAWFVEELSKLYQIPLSLNSKYFGLYGTGNIGEQKIHLLLPTTYMNLSGKSVQSIANFFKIQADEILIAHDELDIDPGTIRLKYDGGHGGHNGLKDTIKSLGNKRTFHRLRIGIGHPGDAKLVVNYVLKKPTIDDRNKINNAIYESTRYINDIINGQRNTVMNELHRYKG